MNINQTAALNLSESIAPPTLRMAQDDANTRTIKASLWDGAQPFSIPSECVCMVRFGKPDGTGGLYDTTESGQKVSYSGNVVTAPVAAQMLAVAGIVKAQIDIYGGGKEQQAEKLATFRFRVEVEPSAYADAKIISSDYYNILSSQIAAAVEAGAKADQAIQAAQQATEAASSASQSQTAAASSAQSASRSAQAASSAASSATSAKTAAESAQEAAQAAKESAASSASAAAQDAQSATQAAAAAMQDADDAEAWAIGKRNGADVPSTDPAYHNNAKYYKEQAQAVVGDKVDSFNGRTGTVTPQEGDYTAEMVGAQPLLTPGDNISITGSTIATKAFPCNPNLLDNWYFGKPVNQMGQTEWLSFASVNVPCVDRWNWWGQYAAGSTLKLLGDGLQLIGKPEATGLYQAISQKIEKDRVPVGATVTLSALVKAEVDANVLLSVDAQSYQGVPVPANTWTLIVAVFNVPSVEQTLNISIQRNTAGATFTVKVVKLELGSQQTLAHQENGAWVLNEIPDYGEQLRRCQRYQYPLCGGSSYAPIGYGFAQTTSQARIFVPTGQTMRATPAVTYLTGGISALRILGGGTAVPVTNIQADNFVSPMGNAAGVVLICTTNGGLTQRACYALTTLSADAAPMFDANL